MASDCGPPALSTITQMPLSGEEVVSAAALVSGPRDSAHSEQHSIALSSGHLFSFIPTFYFKLIANI
jgi:hypothetical protein